MSSVTWSYSALKTFQLCPHKFYRLRIKKDVKEEETEVLRYGNAVHKAAEMYVRKHDPIPEKFSFMQPVLDRLVKIQGKKYCELRMGITEDLEPCEFFAGDVWLRAIVDLLIVNHHTGVAYLIDYKTGSSKYADRDQLEIMALTIFKHFPAVKTIRAALLFLVHDDVVKMEYDLGTSTGKWSRWIKSVARIQAAKDTHVWNKTPNFTCYGCPVTDCEFWKPRRKK